MMTLRQFASKPESIPASTSWCLADLGEARGKQDLFTKQSPQRLKVLRENAMIVKAKDLLPDGPIKGERVVPSSKGISKGMMEPLSLPLDCRPWISVA